MKFLQRLRHRRQRASRVPARVVVALMTLAAFSAAPVAEGHTPNRAPVGSQPTIKVSLATPVEQLKALERRASAAHRPEGSNIAAMNATYAVYNQNCGISSWVCKNRNAILRAAAWGEHSWMVFYHYEEVLPKYLSVRMCSFQARYDTHVGWVVQQYGDKTCVY